MNWVGPLEHPRFKRIVFDPEPHVYSVDGVPVPQSGTGVLKDRFKFDAMAVVEQYYGPNKYHEGWANTGTSEYFDLIADAYDCNGRGHADAKDAIVQLWATKGDEAAPAGTKMHADIEHYAQGLPVPGGVASPELRQYKAVANLLGAEGWDVAGVELFIFYEARDAEEDNVLVFAGAIDMLLRHRHTGEYRMVDHKRVPRKKGKMLGDEFGRPWPFGKAGAPFEAYANCSSFKYAAQLNLYAYCLKHRYGIDCGGRLDLLQMHESLESAHVVRVPRLDAEIERLMAIETQRVRSLPGYKEHCLPEN